MMTLTDSTGYVLPTGAPYVRELVAGETQYAWQNMMDGHSLNRFESLTGATDTIEIRTTDSDTLCIAGTNITAMSVDVFGGTIHDGSDMIANGDLAVWSGGYSGLPDGWFAESYANYEGGEMDVKEIGGYAYNHYLQINASSASEMNAIIREIAVSEGTVCKLSILFDKLSSVTGKYFVLDVTHWSHIIDNVPLPTHPQLSSDDERICFVQEVFTVPAGCTSIWIGFRRMLDSGPGMMRLYGMSLRAATESIGALPLNSNGTYAGARFDTHRIPYSRISGSHSVMVRAQTTDAAVRIGKLATGRMSDPMMVLEGLQTGLISMSPESDIPGGGKLIFDRCNLDKMDVTIRMTVTEANTFMRVTWPAVRHEAMFFFFPNIGRVVFALIADASPKLMLRQTHNTTIAFQLIEAI